LFCNFTSSRILAKSFCNNYKIKRHYEKEARSLDQQETVFRKLLCTATKKSGVYCGAVHCSVCTNQGMFVSKYFLHRNNNNFPMFPTKHTHEFLVAENYGLRNTTVPPDGLKTTLSPQLSEYKLNCVLVKSVCCIIYSSVMGIVNSKVN
jgi:hypothetical protein